MTLLKYFFGGGDFVQGPQNNFENFKIIFSKKSKIIYKIINISYLKDI